MINDRVKMMKVYLKSNIKHFLVHDISDLRLKNYITLESNCNRALLNGSYIDNDFVAPSWYNELCAMKTPVLVINNIDNVNEGEQRKFLEILNYNKISTFDLPSNCIIIVTYKELKINKEIFSLLVEI